MGDIIPFERKIIYTPEADWIADEAEPAAEALYEWIWEYPPAYRDAIWRYIEDRINQVFEE